MSLAAALHRFQTAHGLALPGLSVLEEALRIHRLRDGEAAFREGEADVSLYCVSAGVFKQAYVTEAGAERIKSFAAEGDLFACPFALAGGTASFASVAVGPAVAESIDFRRLQALAAEHPAWQLALRLGFQKLAELKVERERELLCLTPEELYRSYLRRYPELVRRVPQRDLAAFIGVTPVGLNRIVRRVSSDA
ncbi:MAG TPA: Crp/Fnr family transcriptional regulator [Telluria sp.]|nr:Crp/Fnr family transcriptional regulator [Telluria sp.]